MQLNLKKMYINFAIITSHIMRYGKLIIITLVD